MKDMYEPIKALIFYRGGRGDYSMSDIYIEEHSIVTKGNDFSLGSSRPLSEDAFRKLMSLALNSDLTAGEEEDLFIHERLLAMNGEKWNRKLMWYAPARNHFVIFDHRINLSSGEYPFPALLFVSSRKDLEVYAMKTGKKRPTKDTELFIAPIMNQVSDNKLCWGNVDISAENRYEPISKEIARWETALWKSSFSESGTGHVKKLSLVDIYKKSQKDKRFLVSNLVPVGKTINEILKEWQ